MGSEDASEKQRQRPRLGVSLLFSLLVHGALLWGIGAWLTASTGEVQVMVVEIKPPAKVSSTQHVAAKPVETPAKKTITAPVKLAPASTHSVEAAPIIEKVPQEEFQEGPEESVSEPEIEAPAVDDAVAVQQLRESYLHEVMQLVDRHKRYPLMARKLRQQGIVKVMFTLNRSGQLLDCKVEGSSGYRALDRAAYQAVVDVADFPAVPSQFGLTPQFLVAIEFVLN